MQIQELNNLTKLFDCYGRLLTPKQYEVMDKLLNLDIGESEMAELANGSRQSIYDAIKKAKKQLLEFEKKCGFVEHNEKIRLSLLNFKTKLSDAQAKELEKIITKI